MFRFFRNDILPLLYASKFGLFFLLLASLHASYVGCIWIYFRILDLIEYWPNILRHLKDLAFRFWTGLKDFFYNLYTIVEHLLRDIIDKVIELILLEWQWAKEGNFHGLFISLLWISLFFSVTFMVYLIFDRRRKILDYLESKGFYIVTEPPKSIRNEEESSEKEDSSESSESLVDPRTKRNLRLTSERKRR
jgi:hypothetical protein